MARRPFATYEHVLTTFQNARVNHGLIGFPA